MEPLRSTGNFIATDITVREAELIVKYSDGNDSILLRKPCNRSATMKRMQTRDANARYIPIHNIGALKRSSSSDRYTNFRYPNNESVILLGIL
ncbi:hypothetical protein HanXRQr2_Chr10g0464071 [Helianthus annuus]|uniref:Uncharacterized protein n=1 Tax=Helianthus annuus TaxID=4232 RepID=A0A9K3I274_HELAN|nr:hypothetical protein HanXRQr2_Chr10g0464071 [Helianthus annuus]KAJ0885683.1 hypothetical protein HanPSC8_Chr10g0447861 [Helianthus annuus]